MNEFERSLKKNIGKENLKKIQSVRIGIAGAGGLGSNCAFNLARVGFKNFRIVDFDRIDHSNLNRQFYFSQQVGKQKVNALKDNICAINPDAEVEAFQLKLDKDNIKDVFAGCSIVVEAFDKAEEKSMLLEELIGEKDLIVSASGFAGYGSSDDIRVNRIKDNFILIGDLKSDSSEKPPLSPRVNVAAAKQADVILEHVLKRGNCQ